jgi:hypothetical protein
VIKINRRIKGIMVLLLGLQVPNIKSHRSPLLYQLYAKEVSFINKRFIYVALLYNGALHILVKGYYSKYQLLTRTLNHSLALDRHLR